MLIISFPFPLPLLASIFVDRCAYFNTIAFNYFLTCLAIVLSSFGPVVLLCALWVSLKRPSRSLCIIKLQLQQRQQQKTQKRDY